MNHIPPLNARIGKNFAALVNFRQDGQALLVSLYFTIFFNLAALPLPLSTMLVKIFISFSIFCRELYLEIFPPVIEFVGRERYTHTRLRMILDLTSSQIRLAIRCGLLYTYWVGNKLYIKNTSLVSELLLLREQEWEDLWRWHRPSYVLPRLLQLCDQCLTQAIEYLERKGLLSYTGAPWCEPMAVAPVWFREGCIDCQLSPNPAPPVRKMPEVSWEEAAPEVASPSPDADLASVATALAVKQKSVWVEPSRQAPQPVPFMQWFPAQPPDQDIPPPPQSQQVQPPQLAALLAAAQVPLAALQRNGLYFDQAAHRRLVRRCALEQAQAADQLQKIMGQKVNLASGQEMTAWLEAHLDGQTLAEWPKTGTGLLKLDTSTLTQRAGMAVVDALLAYQTASRRLGTYGRDFIRFVDSQTSRLHAKYTLAGTTTGRITCHEPNLQGVPRNPQIRRLFAAPEGRAIVIGDFNQIELRVVALLSGDQALLRAYEQEEDLHRQTAAGMAGIPVEQVTEEQRQAAKAVNFGMLFGMGAEGLVRYARANYGVQMTLAEAQKARSAFFAAYPQLAAWQQALVREARRTLQVRTLCGRVVQFQPGQFRYCQALNIPVQGAAAEVMLAALIQVQKHLVESGLDASLVNTIHDEIVLETSQADVELAMNLLAVAMTEGMLILFPTASTKALVKVTSGLNWAVAKGSQMSDEKTAEEDIDDWEATFAGEPALAGTGEEIVLVSAPASAVVTEGALVLPPVSTTGSVRKPQPGNHDICQAVPTDLLALYMHLGIEGQEALYQKNGGGTLRQRPLVNPMTGKDEHRNPAFALYIRGAVVYWRNFKCSSTLDVEEQPTDQRNSQSSGDVFSFLSLLWDKDQARSLIQQAAASRPAAQFQPAAEDRPDYRPLSWEIWNNAQPISPVSHPAHIAIQYLARRGLHLDTGARFVKLHWKGQLRACMVHAVVDPQGRFTSLNRTFLNQDSVQTGKAFKKAMLGSPAGGSIHLGEPVDGLLGVGEGLETSASARQEYQIAIWACLTAGGLEAVIIPDTVREVWIFSDSDTTSCGQGAALRLTKRLLSEGIRVKIIYPCDQLCTGMAQPKQDFNDLLQTDPSGGSIRERVEGARYEGIRYHYPGWGSCNHILPKRGLVTEVLSAHSLQEGVIHLLLSPTGTGKSLIPIELYNLDEGRVLYVAPLVRLVNQMYERLLKSRNDTGSKKGIAHYRKDTPFLAASAKILVACLPSIRADKKVVSYFLASSAGGVTLVLDEIHALAKELFSNKERYSAFLSTIKERVVRVVAMTATVDDVTSFFMKKLATDLGLPIEITAIGQHQPKVPATVYTWRRPIDKVGFIVSKIETTLSKDPKARIVVIDQSRCFLEAVLLPAVLARFPHLRLEGDINIVTSTTGAVYREGVTLTLGSPSMGLGISITEKVHSFIVGFDDNITTSTDFEQTISRVRDLAGERPTDVSILVRERKACPEQCFQLLVAQERKTMLRLLATLNRYLGTPAEPTAEEKKLLSLNAFLTFNGVEHVYDPTYLQIQAHIRAERRLFRKVGCLGFFRYFQEHTEVLSRVFVRGIQPLGAPDANLEKELEISMEISREAEIAQIETTPSLRNYKQYQAAITAYEEDSTLSPAQKKNLETKIILWKAETAGVKNRAQVLRSIKSQATKRGPLAILNTAFFIFKTIPLEASSLIPQLFQDLRVSKEKSTVLYKIAQELWSIYSDYGKSKESEGSERQELAQKVMAYLVTMPRGQFGEVFGGSGAQTLKRIHKQILQLWGISHHRYGRQKLDHFTQTQANFTLEKGRSYWLLFLLVKRNSLGTQSPAFKLLEEAEGFAEVEKMVAMTASSPLMKAVR